MIPEIFLKVFSEAQQIVARRYCAGFLGRTWEDSLTCAYHDVAHAMSWAPHKSRSIQAGCAARTTALLLKIPDFWSVTSHIEETRLFFREGDWYLWDFQKSEWLLLSDEVFSLTSVRFVFSEK